MRVKRSTLWREWVSRFLTAKQSKVSVLYGSQCYLKLKDEIIKVNGNVVKPTENSCTWNVEDDVKQLAFGIHTTTGSISNL